MALLKPRHLWLGIALYSAGLVVAALILGAWLNLHPCPLCIFQRLLFMIMSVLSLAAFLGFRGPAGRVAGVLTLLVAVSGAAVAGYQIWLQAQPAAMFTCGGANPNLIERLVDWLGQRLPSLFLATGICGDKELVILGYSLAAWSAAAFAAGACACAWTLLAGRRPSG
ncbi:MAG TPA: disulfide bond formation protein B [Thiobacillaceae bacterium]|nr:disulfide bond formation protein B [Thiobacillaceae bacterium]